jgi:hypothetical protein
MHTYYYIPKKKEEKKKKEEAHAPIDERFVGVTGC